MPYSGGSFTSTDLFSGVIVSAANDVILGGPASTDPPPFRVDVWSSVFVFNSANEGKGGVMSLVGSGSAFFADCLFE